MPVPLIHIVDDDEGMRAALVSLLESYGWMARAYPSARDFLDAERYEGPSCLILDVRMPGKDGFGVQAELKARGAEDAIIFLTGHGTIPLGVKAIKEGAVEFLTKPFTESELVDAIRLALEGQDARWARKEAEQAMRWRYELLTQREREIFAFVASGRMNKVIACELGIAEVTVKLHRGRIMEKLALRSAADLVRLAAELKIDLP